jgi:hypothetical protein
MSVRRPPKDKRKADVLFAVTDAFRRARRQMQDHVRDMQGAIKSHQHPPSGTTKALTAGQATASSRRLMGTTSIFTSTVSSVARREFAMAYR